MKSKVKVELFLNVDRTLWKNSDIIALFKYISKIDESNISEGCKIELEKMTDKNISDIA